MNRGQKINQKFVSKEAAWKSRIGIIVSRFNEDITEKLLEGAIETLTAHGVVRKNINVTYVPGGFEIPLACQRLAKSRKKYHALIAIGCVIKGDTDHYYYIAGESTRGTMDIMLKTGVPIANCILTLNTLKQAQARTKTGSNKGAEAALAALSMVY